MNNIVSFIYRHRYDFFFSALLVILFSVLFIFGPKEETKNIINFLENKTFDIRQKIISTNKKANKDIVIITIDDPSYEFLIEKYGDWPIPRNVYAQVLNYIQAQEPKYTAFDLLFIKPLNRIKGSDEKLINAFKENNNTYTAINFDNYSPELRTPPILNDKLKSKIETDSNNLSPYLYKNCRLIMDEIINATDNIGHINTPKSDDGFIRSVPIIIAYPDYSAENLYDYYLYMTVKLAIDYLNKYEKQDIKSLKIDKNNNLILGTRKIPLTKNAEAVLNWYPSSEKNSIKTFNHISFWEVIKSAEAKANNEPELIPQDFFKDKIVYIGTSVSSLSDIKTVPTSKYMPGVEVHATLLNNVIDNNFIKEVSTPNNMLLTLLLAVISGLIVFKIRSVLTSGILFASLMCGYIYLATYIMEKLNLWIWIIIPLLFAVFIFICSYLIKYLLKARDFEYTYKLATTDGLTELYNHRFFQEQMKKMIYNAEKNNTNFSLLILDIDFFKKFNDKYGHQAGDAVLKHVSRTLKSCVRKNDYVCRYGGEEITVILDNINKEQALTVAQKICETIASKSYSLTPDLEVKITVSLGSAAYPEDGKTSTELIEYADKCLYKAKENGRNQVGNL